jgi:hypothetical protein
LSEDVISRKKPIYPVGEDLMRYLKHYGRVSVCQLQYKDLLHFRNSFPVYDRFGKDTLWESVNYSPEEMDHLNKTLTGMYALLKTAGDVSVIEHLYVERVDYCTFGNSKPFRVKIVNNYNDNFDYFYIKQADSSRIYGLELEHILSPNRISYFVDRETLVEEHIAGIPGDMFISTYLGRQEMNPIRLAKEFVKFNERCFVRLLGDMRAYNYVVDITPDFEDVHYRIRAIDFDQQSFEGRRSLYMPQYFRDNNPIVQLCIQHMTPQTVHQYQVEERTMMAKRICAARYMTRELLETMKRDPISTDGKIQQLGEEMAAFYKSNEFLKCKSMGCLVKSSLQEMIRRNKHHL